MHICFEQTAWVICSQTSKFITTIINNNKCFCPTVINCVVLGINNDKQTSTVNRSFRDRLWNVSKIQFRNVQITRTAASLVVRWSKTRSQNCVPAVKDGLEMISLTVLPDHSLDMALCDFSLFPANDKKTAQQNSEKNWSELFHFRYVIVWYYKIGTGKIKVDIVL